MFNTAASPAIPQLQVPTLNTHPSGTLMSACLWSCLNIAYVILKVYAPHRFLLPSFILLTYARQWRRRGDAAHGSMEFSGGTEKPTPDSWGPQWKPLDGMRLGRIGDLGVGCQAAALQDRSSRCCVRSVAS